MRSTSPWLGVFQAGTILAYYGCATLFEFIFESPRLSWVEASCTIVVMCFILAHSLLGGQHAGHSK